MNDRRQIAFAQTQTKKPKSKKTRAPKLRKVGTSALNKQKKLKRVNETFLKLEQDCRNLLAANAQLKEEIDRLNKLLEITQANLGVAEATLLDLQRVMAEDYISPDEAQRLKVEAYNEGLSAFAWWKDGVQYVGTCGKLLKDYLK